MITMELGSRDFWWKVNIFLNKSKSAILQLLSGVEVLSSAFGKSKLFAEIISENSNLDGLENFLSFRSSRTIPKLHNHSVTEDAEESYKYFQFLKGIWSLLYSFGRSE